MPFSIAQRLMGLSVPTPLAIELDKQITTGVFNYKRLMWSSMGEALARYVADSLQAGTYVATKAVELGAIPAVANILTELGVRIDLVPVSADEFYVKTGSSTGRVIAHRFVKNMGDVGPTSIGAPFGVWRYVGTIELNTFADAVTAPRSVWSVDDLGAQDYAYQRASDGVFGGSFHGGETASGQVIYGDGRPIDPTVAATYSRFSFSQSSVISWGAGQTVTASYVLSVGRQGRLTITVPSSSNVNMTLAYVGMVIGTGVFTEIINAGSTSTIPLGITDFGKTTSIVMRNPSSGHRISINTNAPSNPTYSVSRMQRALTAPRTKFYPMIVSGGAPGSTNVTWTVDFSRDTSYSAATNLVANGDFATGIDGWISTTGGANVSYVGGKLRMTRSASQETRTIFPIICEVGAQYDFNVSCVQSPADAGARTAISSNANGSIASPAPALANEAYLSSVFPRRFTATQAQHWVWLNQPTGTAGQTADWDDVTVTRVVP